MALDLMVHLEGLRDRGDRRLTGVETIRAARSLRLRFHLLSGSCATEGTSQIERAGHIREANWIADLGGRTLPFCEECARWLLHGRARILRHNAMFPDSTLEVI